VIAHRLQLRTLRAGALAAVVALVLAACGGGGGGGGTQQGGGSAPPKDEGTPKPGGKLVVALDAETDGFDPSQNRWAVAGYYVANAVFDPLTKQDADGNWHPYLAESLTPNNDFTEWTIKLRPGIKFHNGEPLNADAVVLHFDRLKKSFLTGQAFTPMQRWEKVDDLTVKVSMSTPWSTFPYYLSRQGGFIPAPAQYNAPDAERTGKPIGTGPYMFKEWVRDDHLTVVKNPNYWRRGLPYLDEITFRPIPDQQVRLAAVQSGDVQVMMTSDDQSIIAARKDKSLRIREEKTDEPAFFMINTAKEPLSDLRLRKALALATDRAQLNDLVGGGIRELAESPWSKGSKWYSPSGWPAKPDYDAARKLVEEYKAEKGITGPVKITYEDVPSPTARQVAELIKTMWEKAGFSVQQKSVEQTEHINNALLGNYDIVTWRQFGSADPDYDYIWWHSSTAKPIGELALNFARNKDPQIDAALDAARRTTDEAERKRQYAIVAKRLAEDVPYLWQSFTIWGIVSRPAVKGLYSGTMPDGAPLPPIHAGEVWLNQAWLAQ
jgi:ABC-type transport system substrate-binding protein